MTQKERGPEVAGSATQPGHEDNKSPLQFTTGKPPKKILRVLAALARGERLHRFEAERRLGEHALPSTISELHNRKGIKIARRDISVPGYGGEPAYVALYWLDPNPENVARARALLGTWANP
jgi:hypothetical protein